MHKPKLDRNGYAKSLFDTEDGVCYICKSERQTVRHEVVHGASRQLAKYYGLWINVCPVPCHSWIHREDNGKFYYLKEEAQRLFEKEHPDKDFLIIFGRKYF